MIHVRETLFYFTSKTSLELVPVMLSQWESFFRVVFFFFFCMYLIVGASLDASLDTWVKQMLNSMTIQLTTSVKCLTEIFRLFCQHFWTDGFSYNQSTKKNRALSTKNKNYKGWLPHNWEKNSLIFKSL